jgi:hypothetical protein
MCVLMGLEPPLHKAIDCGLVELLESGTLQNVNRGYFAGIVIDVENHLGVVRSRACRSCNNEKCQCDSAKSAQEHLTRTSSATADRSEHGLNCGYFHNLIRGIRAASGWLQRLVRSHRLLSINDHLPRRIARLKLHTHFLDLCRLFF